MVDSLGSEIERESRRKTTPFGEKYVVYRLVKNIHLGCQTQYPWSQFLDFYVEGYIKQSDHEKGTVYACYNMGGKYINYKSGNSDIITHIKARHEVKCLKFVSDKKGRLKRPSTNGNIRDLFNH